MPKKSKILHAEKSLLAADIFVPFTCTFIGSVFHFLTGCMFIVF